MVFWLILYSDLDLVSGFSVPTNYTAKAIHDYCTGVEGDLSVGFLGYDFSQLIFLVQSRRLD
jgi:hypothetical protein